MPTENRSSNTEMVSKPTADQPVDTFRGDNQHLISCIKALLTLDAKGSLIPHGIGGHARELLSSAAARLGEQRHGEPVAWQDPQHPERMCTAGHKEYALSKGGAPAKALIPLTTPLYTHPAPAVQKGERVGEVVAFGEGLHEIAWVSGRMPGLGAVLYTHADAGEVERLRKEVSELEQLRRDEASRHIINEAKAEAQLAERDALLGEVLCHAIRSEPVSAACRGRIEAALSASAEPSAPKLSVTYLGTNEECGPLSTEEMALARKALKDAFAPDSVLWFGSAHEPIEFSEDEIKFLKAVAEGEDSKQDEIYDSEGTALWERLEKFELIECTGSRRWKLTFDVYELGIRAALERKP